MATARMGRERDQDPSTEALKLQNNRETPRAAGCVAASMAEPALLATDFSSGIAPSGLTCSDWVMSSDVCSPDRRNSPSTDRGDPAGESQ